ncbi:MAG: dTMP kinase [Kiritimatiellae bacterium]|nr:dTMP kinase [Kiritimatiellia bacterium]
MDRKGRFITFEGGEGCGKSTQTRLLADFLSASGREVLLVREPGGTGLGESIRSILKAKGGDEPCDRAELFLFLAARAQLVEKVLKPALEEGKWIVCDRFFDSTVAYQGYGRGMDIAQILAANSFACAGLRPDVTFLLDLDLDAARNRMRGREAATNTEADRIELAGDGFHSRLRQGFLDLASKEPERIKVIDASRSVDEIADEIRAKFDWTI